MNAEDLHSMTLEVLSLMEKVIEQVPLPANKNKSFSICKCEESNDPLKILQSRGLLSIENPQIDPESSASEVDLTFYTEENRLGEVVKIFSSTHKFRNGQLVFSTTQEATPVLSEEIGKFNEWWNTHGPGRLKNAKNAAVKERKGTRRKLSDIFKEIQRQEVVKRYESASRKSLGLSRWVEPKSHGRQLDIHAEKCKTITDNSRKEHHHIHHDAKIRQSPHHCLSDDQREDIEGIEDTNSQVRYRAKWRHTSPKKTQRYESRNFKESPRSCQISPRKGLDQKSPRKSLDIKTWLEEQFRSQQTSKSLEKFRNKVSPFIIAKRIHHSYTKLNSPMRFRPTPTRKVSSSERWRQISPTRNRRDFCSLSMHKDKMPDRHQHDKYRMYRVEKHHPSSDEDTSSESCRKKHSPQRYRSNEIVGLAPSKGVIIHGEESSSELNASVSTFRDHGNGDCTGKNGSPGSVFSAKVHQKNHKKNLNVRVPSSMKNKARGWKANLSAEDSQRHQSNSCMEDDMKCYAFCHKKNTNHHHKVILTTGKVSNRPNMGLLDKHLETRNYVESLVNEKALVDFNRRCNKCKCKFKDSNAHKSFNRENQDNCQQDRRDRQLNY
ncbi:uncharacterized protein TNCT_377831 [Trichonephila clavata]|uniref:Uncharacterized protein n=1 Tax=Trichonephila clavata TaxID=2740835 RepID=A0A8X6GF70_TRICU|nr:uncharacterized protein TNCT_377831 [Trichonephila clavata]